MAVRILPARASSNGRAPNNGDVRPDNRLDFVDQAFFAGHRAAGQTEVMQVVWIYEHAIDMDALKRFHHNFGYGLLGRRIERSPLPFARHRWVLHRGQTAIDIAECARPRTELSDWADERSQLLVDPERGTGWHLGVLPLTDGTTALSLVTSHYLLDGLGLMASIVEAVLGMTRDLGYPPPRSRTRFRALVEDARQTAWDVPELARAFVAAAKLGRGHWHDLGPSAAARPREEQAALPAGDTGDAFVVPGATIVVNLDQWCARAEALGGTSNTLAAGLTAKLGEHIGRRRDSDGAVTLALPISGRAEGDTRALALTHARVSVDPTRLTTDLRDARAAINQALKTLRETPDASERVAPLALVTPKGAMKQLVDGGLTDPDRPVVCSNIGETAEMVWHLDGTHAEWAMARGTRQHVTRQWLEGIGGQMQLLSFRTPVLNKIFISLLAYQPGAENTKAGLRELAARTLAEFGLTGEIE